MPETSYPYNVDADLGGSVNTGDLFDEIVAAQGITTAPARVDGAGGSTSNGVQAGGTISVVMKDAIDAGQQTALDAVIAAHVAVADTQPDTVQLAGTQADGTPLVALKGRFGKEVIYATHNLCDETTWYSEALRRTEHALTDSGDGLTFTSGDQCWIDMLHGKVFDEEGLIEDQQIFAQQSGGDPHGYAVVVEVEEDPIGAPGVWTPKTARAPFANDGGDFTIDYTAGSITFAATQTGNVRASYSYKGGSGWILKPLPGRALLIEKAEIQFAINTEMTDTFIMEAYGLVDVFAPELMTTADPPGPIPPGTSIPIEGTLYKTIDQIIDEAIMAFPPIPALGGPRGFTQPRHVFQFHYAALRTLWSSLGMFLRISIANDVSFDGERATATFYCTSKTDPGITGALALLTAE